MKTAVILEDNKQEHIYDKAGDAVEQEPEAVASFDSHHNAKTFLGKYACRCIPTWFSGLRHPLGKRILAFYIFIE